MAATKRKMNFANVKDGGNFSPKHVKEGDYRMRVVKVEDHISNSGNEQWLFTLKREGDERASYPYYCGVDEKQAWKIRNFFIAAGIQVPKKMVMVDPNKLVGKVVGAFLEDDEYEGRMRSKIAELFPADDVSEPDDEDENEAPRTKKKTSKKAAPVEDDDEEVEEEVEEDEDNTSDDEDEDEDDEPEPPKKKAVKKAKAPAKKAKAKRRPADDDDEDEDLDLDEL